jgi:hypothetical protein
MKPAINLGGKIATIQEVINGKTTQIIFNGIQAGSR